MQLGHHLGISSKGRRRIYSGGRELGVEDDGGEVLGASVESGAVAGGLGQWIFSLVRGLCLDLIVVLDEDCSGDLGDLPGSGLLVASAGILTTKDLAGVPSSDLLVIGDKDCLVPTFLWSVTRTPPTCAG